MNKEEIIKKLENTGFIKNNNIKVEEVKENEYSILKATITETSLNPYGIAHGGFIFGLGDTAMGVAAASTGRTAVTLSSNINYIKKATGKYLRAKSEIVKSGKTTCFLSTKIYNDKDELVATMDANYFFMN